jgi:hypothetical protein
MGRSRRHTDEEWDDERFKGHSGWDRHHSDSLEDWDRLPSSDEWEDAGQDEEDLFDSY